MNRKQESELKSCFFNAFLGFKTQISVRFSADLPEFLKISFLKNSVLPNGFFTNSP